MTIVLNHTIVPARDKLAAARLFASIFGLNFNEQESEPSHQSGLSRR